MASLPKLIPFPGAHPAGETRPETPADDAPSAAASTTSTAGARQASLEAALAQVRQKWGYGSIVRLDRAGALSDAQRPRRPKSARELPPWWPHPLGPHGASGVLRPRLLEVVAEPGGGRLTLSLAWLAAARPTLAALVDPAVPASPITGEAQSRGGSAGVGLPARHWSEGWDGPPLVGKPVGAPPEPMPSNDASDKRFDPSSTAAHRWPERFYPPAAATAGIDLDRLIVVSPPAGDPRAALDAVVILLRSEAFDVILCPLAARARISTSFAAKLATLAARAGTTLLLLTPPTYTADGYASNGAGALAAFADYRVRLATRRWLWEDGELAGMRLRAITERARASSQASAALDVPDPQNAAGAVEHDLTFRLHRSLRYGPSATPLSLTTSRRLTPADDDLPATDQTGNAIPSLRLVAGA